MNRRTFLHRAALALGGALLAPLMLARTGHADPADPTATDEYGGGPGVGHARTLPRTGGDPTTPDDSIPDDWSDHIRAGYEPVGWVKAFDPADIERATAEPVEPWDFPTTTTAAGNITISADVVTNTGIGPGVFIIEHWDGTAWHEVGDA